MKTYDVIVIGVGGMGSAALYHLANQGLSVLGLERYNIPNSMGSSHGITRIIRLAYYEHPSYVLLLKRAYQLWRELEKNAQESLLFLTGSIDASKEDSWVFKGSKKSCEEHHLSHEILSAKELNKKFPGYELPNDIFSVYQPDGGFLLSERCIVAHVSGAQREGAEIHGQEQVLSWEFNKNRIKVITNKNEYFGKKLIITAGAWNSKLISELNSLAMPERQVLAWFQPLQQKLFLPNKFPVFNIEVEEGRYYGFPIFGIPGFKVGRYHHLNQQTDPDQMDRNLYLEDENLLRHFTQKYFPQAAGPTLSLMPCLFTNSPDEHFIIDTHPDYSQIIFAAGFSGHGYKFCSVIGEVLADLAETGLSKHDLSLFRLSRFVQS